MNREKRIMEQEGLKWVVYGGQGRGGSEGEDNEYNKTLKKLL